MSGLVYLASPYSHPEHMVREMRFQSVCVAAARLMDDGYEVFAPIAHGHSVETYGMGEPKSQEFWMKQCVSILRHCSKLYVLKLHGWEKSPGVQEEVRLAKELHIPVEYLEP